MKSTINCQFKYERLAPSPSLTVSVFALPGVWLRCWPRPLHFIVVSWTSLSSSVKCHAAKEHSSCSLATGNWQRSDVARPMLRIRNALCLSLAAFLYVCVCVCKLPACRYLTQDSPNGRLLPSATARRSGTNKVRIV